MTKAELIEKLRNQSNSANNAWELRAYLTEFERTWRKHFGDSIPQTIVDEITVKIQIMGG